MITQKQTKKRKKEDESENVKENNKIPKEIGVSIEKTNGEEEESEENEFFKMDTYPKDESKCQCNLQKNPNRIQRGCKEDKRNDYETQSKLFNWWKRSKDNFKCTN